MTCGTPAEFESGACRGLKSVNHASEGSPGTHLEHGGAAVNLQLHQLVRHHPQQACKGSVWEVVAVLVVQVKVGQLEVVNGGSPPHKPAWQCRSCMQEDEQFYNGAESMLYHQDMVLKGYCKACANVPRGAKG